MAALRDRTFNKGAWARLGVVALGLLAAALLVYISVGLHHQYVELPRLLGERYADPLGYPGQTTTQIASLGGEAVDTLIADLKPGQSALHRAKSLEILSAIDDPRVVPAMVRALSDKEIGIRLAALAGLARMHKGDVAKHIWPHVHAKSSFFRHRAMVALGLVSEPADVPKLLAAAKDASGRDRLLLIWAAGYAQRRAKLKDPSSDRVRPMKLEDAVQERKVQAEVDELRAAFRSGDITAERAERLAELVTIDFGTWNLNHQISYQTLMVAGPLAVRGVARIEPPAPAAAPGDGAKGAKAGAKAKGASPKPAPMEGLKLKHRPEAAKSASK